MNKEKHDHPKVILLKRGGKYRHCFMVQPYLNTVARDIYRCAVMEI